MDAFTFKRNGQTIHLINTPGFSDFCSSDALLLSDIAAYLNQACSVGITIHGIIYLHPIKLNRLQGSATKFLRIKKICGAEALHAILPAARPQHQQTHTPSPPAPNGQSKQDAGRNRRRNGARSVHHPPPAGVQVADFSRQARSAARSPNTTKLGSRPPLQDETRAASTTQRIRDGHAVTTRKFRGLAAPLRTKATFGAVLAQERARTNLLIIESKKGELVTLQNLIQELISRDSEIYSLPITSNHNHNNRSVQLLKDTHYVVENSSRPKRGQ